MKISFFNKKHSAKKEKSGSSAREFIAKLSRGLMLPIAMLPIAGLFLGIGNAIASNCSSGSFGNVLGMVIKAPGQVIFDNLAVLFAVAIAITFTGDIGVAGLSSFVGWIVFCALQSAFIITKTHTDADGKVIVDWYRFLFYTFEGDKGITMFNAIFTSNVGIKSLCTSVFGGLTVGFVVAFLYNKFKNIQLPQIIGFFSGIRFIPIITFIVMIPLSILFSLVWPGIGIGLYYLGYGLGYIGDKTYGFNSFIFGYIERSLVPFGLHHAFYTPLWYTAVGGQINFSDAPVQIVYDGHTYANWIEFAKSISPTSFKDGSTFGGDQSCWFILSQIAGKTVTIDGVQTHLTFENLPKLVDDSSTVNVGQYMQGKYPFMMFALPAAAAAMVTVIPKGNNRKVASSIIFSAALTSFLTGITEPLEFTFLFLAPWLYWGFHAFFCAMSFWFMNLLGAHMGMTFSGGLIDFCIYGVLPDSLGAGANCYWAVIIGLVLIPIYYFSFYYFIKKFDIKTPGRDGAGVNLFSKKDYLAAKEGKTSEINKLSNAVINAYGGKENIKNVDACITKLRIQVIDPNKVDKKQLMDLGARGVVNPSKQSVYAVFGTQADRIKNEMKDIISGKSPTIDNQKFEKVVKSNNTKQIKTIKQLMKVFAPVDGKVVPLTKVNDETFSQNIMGRGFAIIPSNGNFVSPINGTITLVNNHAFSIRSKEGYDILVHIGIDTVKLSDKNVFKYSVKIGDEVNVGDKIVTANLNMIKSNKLDPITPVIILNETIGSAKIKTLKNNINVKAKTEVIEIK